MVFFLLRVVSFIGVQPAHGCVLCQLRVVHEHFAAPRDTAAKDVLAAAPFFPAAVDRILIRGATVTLRLHDGLAFAAEGDTGEAGGGGDDDEGGLMAGFMEVKVTGLHVSVDTYALDAPYVSRILVLVDRLEVLDRVRACCRVPLPGGGGRRAVNPPLARGPSCACRSSTSS